MKNWLRIFFSSQSLEQMHELHYQAVVDALRAGRQFSFWAPRP